MNVVFRRKEDRTVSLNLVYFDTALAKACRELPGMHLNSALAAARIQERDRLQGRLERACRKLCLMWQAADWAIESEEEFCLSTVREAPALLGRECVTVHYHHP